MALYNDGIFNVVESRQLPLENRHDSIRLNFKYQKTSAQCVFPEGCGRFADPIALLKQFPWREVSATRSFPPGCGRNAPRINAEEHLKSVSSEKGNSVGCERPSSELRPSEKTVSIEANHGGERIQDGCVCRHPPVGASNCFCRQGKQVTNYNSTGTVGINGKKHRLMVVEKSIYAPSEKKHRTENSEGLAAKKKVPPTGKVAYLDPSQIVARHEDGNVGHDKEDGNAINGCRAIASHGRVIETLNLFRNILKEEEKRSKEQGYSIKRIDMLALDRLKRMNMWDNSRKAILGSIPKVKVGDKFQFRVELSIVGLHRPFQSGIDYLERSGKIIATSIVASGGYDNDIYGPDVLVYSGQGGKPMRGDKQPKDQKLERGNLALKNSIGAKNSVRVILGSKEVKDSDSINLQGEMVSYYVYNGLYSVEKYWQETGCSGTSIFKFQLRRYADQP